MPANRRVIRPSNAAGPFSGTSFMEDVGEEIEKLWDYAIVPLTNWAGTANAQTADCLVPILANGQGRNFIGKFPLANTGAMTLAIDGKPAKALVNRDGSALAAGRISTSRWEEIADTGTEFTLMNDPPPPSTSVLRSLFAYELAAGTSGASAVIGWNTYRLNTVVANNIPGVSLNAAAFQLSLPARTYEWFEAEAYHSGDAVGLYLWNVTDNQLIPGQARAQTWADNRAGVRGSFTLAGTKVVELRFYSSGAAGAGRLGTPLNITAPVTIPEQYGYLMLESR